MTKADERGQILFANTALAQLLDYDSSYDLIRATGGLYERIVHPDDRSRLMAAIEQLAFSADGAKMGDFAFRGLARDGGIKELSATFQFVDIENSGKTLYTYFKTA